MREFAVDIWVTVARCLSWWRGELESLLPVGLRSTGGRPTSDLTVLVSDGAMVGAIPAFSERADDDFLLDEIRQRSLRRPLRVRLRIPMSECLVRSMAVPRSAMPDVARIAALDLERTTPFRSDEIYSAVAIGDVGRGRGPVMVDHIVVKRGQLAAVRARIEGAGGEIAGVDCYRDDPTKALAIDFLSDPLVAPDQKPRAVLPSSGVLATTAGTLAVAALAITTYRHEHALLALKDETAAIRVRVVDARAQRTAGDQALLPSLVRWKSTYPPVVEVFEDISRRLPDTAYVTQFRLTDGAVELGGFGRPVRNLAPELEQSPYVESATITAPIVTDESLQKERFELRLRLAKRSLDDNGTSAVETSP